MAHDDKLQQAKEAIDKVHNDTSVDIATTKASLEDLNTHIFILLDALETSE